MSTPSSHWFVLTPDGNGHWTLSSPDGVVLASVQAPAHQTFRLWLIAGLSMVASVVVAVVAYNLVQLVAPARSTAPSAGLIIGFFASIYLFAFIGMRITDEPVTVSRGGAEPAFTLKSPRAVTLDVELDIKDVGTDSRVGRVSGQNLLRGGEVIASYALCGEGPLPPDVVQALRLSSDRLGAECINVSTPHRELLFQLRRPAPLLDSALVFADPEVLADELLLTYALYLTAAVAPQKYMRM